MNQTQIRNTVNDYYDQNRKNNIKDIIKKLFILILALIHKFLAYPYLREELIKILNDNNIDANIVEYILIVYLILTELFLLIAAWKIIKNIRVLNAVFVIAALAYIGIYGYSYFKTTTLYDQITNRPKASFVIEAKELCSNAKTYWQKETITNGSKQQTYTKNNGVYCNNKRLAFTDENTNYSITVDYQGKIIDYKVTNGKFQFSFSGTDLNVDDIRAEKFVKVDDNNRLIIPQCSN